MDQHHFRAFREHQVTQSGLVDKLVTGKLGKQQFIDQVYPLDLYFLEAYFTFFPELAALPYFTH